MSSAAGTPAVRGGSGFSAYKRLLGYIRPYRAQFFLGVLGAILFAATMASFALFVRSFGDGTFVHRDPRTICLGAAAAWSGCSSCAAWATSRRLISWATWGGASSVRCVHEVFRRILNLPIGYFDRHSTGVLLSRLTYNAEQVGAATTDSIVTIVRSAADHRRLHR